MKVKMKVYISGTRDGKAWPYAGAVIDVPDDEGAMLCRNDLATPVAEKEPVEKATVPDDSEKRSDEPAEVKVETPARRKPGRPRKT